MDTTQGECRICGIDTDLIEGECEACVDYLNDFEKWRGRCAYNYEISEQDRELFVAYLRSED